MAESLDLNQKVEPQVKIIDKITMQQRPWHKELIEALFVIFFAVMLLWGVSKADITQQTASAPEITSFSVLGLVSDITGSSFSLNNINVSEYAPNSSYTFDTSTLQKIETNEYVPLQFSDIQIGDKIVVQGTSENNIFSATRIIDFTSTASSTAVATTTATTTEQSLNATSTVTISTIVATSTDDIASSTATTTPSLNDDIIDAVQNIIDTLSGTTTSTSTDNTNNVTATSTEEVTPTTTSSSTPEIIPDTPPSVPDASPGDTTTDTATSTL